MLVSGASLCGVARRHPASNRQVPVVVEYPVRQMVVEPLPGGVAESEGSQLLGSRQAREAWPPSVAGVTWSDGLPGHVARLVLVVGEVGGCRRAYGFAF